jgi:uncharacterized protein (TIGR00369 family)
MPDDTIALARSRTFSWEDPVSLASAARAMPGLELLRGIRDGSVPPPPVMHLLDYALDEVEEGRVTCRFEPREFHYNTLGSLHGGVIATLLDTAAGCAVHSTLPAGIAYTTLDLKVTYLRAVTASSGPLRCEGRVLHAGSRIAMSEARLEDAAGKLHAHATSTCLVLRP